MHALSGSASLRILPFIVAAVFPEPVLGEFIAAMLAGVATGCSRNAGRKPGSEQDGHGTHGRPCPVFGSVSDLVLCVCLRRVPSDEACVRPLSSTLMTLSQEN